MYILQMKHFILVVTIMKMTLIEDYLILRILLTLIRRPTLAQMTTIDSKRDLLKPTTATGSTLTVSRFLLLLTFCYTRFDFLKS